MDGKELNVPNLAEQVAYMAYVATDSILSTERSGGALFDWLTSGIHSDWLSSSDVDTPSM